MPSRCFADCTGCRSSRGSCTRRPCWRSRSETLQHQPTPAATMGDCPRSLRSSGAPLLAQPLRRTDFAARGFRYSAPAVWKSLPRTVGLLDSSSLTVFKSRFKTQLFHLAHNDRRGLTSSATAFEVTTLRRYRKCVYCYYYLFFKYFFYFFYILVRPGSQDPWG